MKKCLFNVSLFSFSRQASSVLAAAALALAMTGCQNYTTTPLCKDSNAVVPDGITGTYQVSMQDPETFEVKTQLFDIRDDGDRLHFDGHNPVLNDDARICAVGSWLIVENFKEGINAYEQNRLYITNMGLTYKHLMFNRATLESAGLPYQIITIPEELSRFMGPKITGQVNKWLNHLASYAEAKGLVVDNSQMTSSDLIEHTSVSPVGFSLLRK